MLRLFIVTLIFATLGFTPHPGARGEGGVREVLAARGCWKGCLPPPPLVVQLPNASSADGLTNRSDGLPDDLHVLDEMPLGRRALFWRSDLEGRPEFLDIPKEIESLVMARALRISNQLPRE